MKALESISAEVLVVGGGGAGCRAAIEAHDQGAKVLMIVKGRLGHSGCTLNVGISSAVGPWGNENDSNESSMRDLLAHGGYLGNQDLAKILVEDSPDRVVEMERWGIDFDRTEAGTMKVVQDPEHSYPRSFYFKPSFQSRHDYGAPPGIAMMDTLIKEMQKRKIQVMDDVLLVDLIKRDGCVVGATALDCKKNKMISIGARSVVLATGTYSQIFDPTTVSLQETGDGHCAAYRAGAELVDMENTQFVATDSRFSSESVFLNGRGEEFLPNYGINSPRDIAKEELCYAVWKEVRDGRGTPTDKIYIDLAGDCSRDVSSSLLSPRTTCGQCRYCVSGDEDLCNFPKGVVESGPMAHTATGGIRINDRCETTLPGLYAAGAVAGAVYGHARPQGYTSMITLVLGRRAGMFAGQFQTMSTSKRVLLDASEIQASMHRAIDVVGRTSGLTPSAIKTQIRSIMKNHAWVIKDEEGLTKGLEKIKDLMRISIGQSVVQTQPKDGFDWANHLDVSNMLLTAEMMLTGALERKESRGAFFRDDYPNTDDENWLRNILYSQINGNLTISTIPVELKYCAPETNLTAGRKPKSR